ncbi:hypothetical protein DZA29_13360 [Citrobacter gillenii]|nr:hypothetical protein DZA29_13360 [Citrobacter gillenii]
MKNVNLILLGDSTQPQEKRMKEALKISKGVKPAAVLDAVKEAYDGTGKKPSLNYAQLARWRKGLTYYRSPPTVDAIDPYTELFTPLYQLLENPVVVASIDVEEFEQRLRKQVEERERLLSTARREEAERIMKESEERDHNRLMEELSKLMDKLRELRKD